MLSCTPTPKSMALFTRNASISFRPFSISYCPYYKIQGHLLEDCFKAGNEKPLTCSHCYMSGHLVEKCYKLMGQPSSHKLYNKVKRSNVHASQSNMIVIEDFSKNHTDKMTLIPNQYQKILQFFHEKHNLADTYSPMPYNSTTPFINYTSLTSMSGIATCLSTYTHNFFVITNVYWIINTEVTHRMICSTIVFYKNHSHCVL